MAAVAGQIFAQNASLECCLTSIGVIGNLVAFGLSLLFQAEVSAYLAVTCAISYGVFLIISQKWIRFIVSAVVVLVGIAELFLIHGQFAFQFSVDVPIIGGLINDGLQWLADALALLPQVMGYVNAVVGGYMFLVASTTVFFGGAATIITNYYEQPPNPYSPNPPNPPNLPYLPYLPNPRASRTPRRGRRGRRTRAILQGAGQPFDPLDTLVEPAEEKDDPENSGLPLLAITV
jgi:multisubunit Na+/H+ antiporter MnhC subunit